MNEARLACSKPHVKCHIDAICIRKRKSILADPPTSLRRAIVRMHQGPTKELSALYAQSKSGSANFGSREKSQELGTVDAFIDNETRPLDTFC